MECLQLLVFEFYLYSNVLIWTSDDFFFFSPIFWDDRLDVYIYDYLMKRKLHNTAKSFQAEGQVSTDPVGKNSYKIRSDRGFDMFLVFI